MFEIIMMIASWLSMAVWIVILHFEITATAITFMVTSGLAFVLWFVNYRMKQ